MAEGDPPAHPSGGLTPLAACLPFPGKQAADRASLLSSAVDVKELEEDEPVKPTCPQCRGAKYVHPRQNGKINWTTTVPCRVCCDHYYESRNCNFDESGIPEAKRCCTFDSFEPVAGAIEALKLARLLGTGKADFKLLLIYGRRGSGKTHLACAAGLAAIERNLRVRFRHAGSLMGELRQAMNASRDKGSSADDIIDDLKRCDFLILDDLGTEQGTAWDQNCLGVLINHRYAEEKETMVTTHQDQKEVNDYIFSRFTDARISRRVLNSAADYRPRKGKTSGA